MTLSSGLIRLVIITRSSSRTPTGDGLLPHRVPGVDHLYGPCDRAVLVVVLAPRPSAPRRHLQVPVVRLSHEDVDEIHVVEVLAGEDELLQILLAGHSLGVLEDEPGVGPRSEAGPTGTALHRHDNSSSGFNSFDRRETAGEAATDDEDIGLDGRQGLSGRRGHWNTRRHLGPLSAPRPSSTTSQPYSAPSKAPSVMSMASVGQYFWHSLQTWQSSR